MAGLQQQQFKITGGMNQDIDVQSSSPTLAYRLFNIKNQTLENSNMNNLTNENGNSQLMLIDALTGEYFSIAGTVIGIIQCTPSVAVLFTYISSSSNAIYKLTYDKDADNIKVRTVARGNFGIPKTHIKDGKTQDMQISGVFVYEHSEVAQRVLDLHSVIKLHSAVYDIGKLPLPEDFFKHSGDVMRSVENCYIL